MRLWSTFKCFLCVKSFHIFLLFFFSSSSSSKLQGAYEINEEEENVYYFVNGVWLWALYNDTNNHKEASYSSSTTKRTENMLAQMEKFLYLFFCSVQINENFWDGKWKHLWIRWNEKMQL